MKVCILALLVWSSAGAETIDQALQTVESRAQAVVSRQNGETWGVRTATDDLNRLVAQSQRLSASLSSDDARDVQALEQGLRSATRRLRTSGVMLESRDQAEVEEIVAIADQVAGRLADLRLRFGSQANTVAGNLSSVPMEPSSTELGYENIQALLIDVRWAREAAQSLQPARFPYPGFLGFGQPNNLDPLQVRRVVQAAWALERQLSVRLDDVSQSYPEWERLSREYNRLGYMGTGRSARQLERVMNRLGDFYESENF